jgi:hypothetical protein
MSSTLSTQSVEARWEKEWENWRISSELQHEFLEIFQQVDSDRDGFITGLLF